MDVRWRPSQATDHRSLITTISTAKIPRGSLGIPIAGKRERRGLGWERLYQVVMWMEHVKPRTETLFHFNVRVDIVQYYVIIMRDHAMVGGGLSFSQIIPIRMC